MRLLANHDGLPLARTASGTLQLREVTNPAQDLDGLGKTGLRVAADLDPSNPQVQQIVSAMRRGDLDQMSFGFQVTQDEWNDDMSERTIREVKLFDVSVVTYPANPATSVSLNSARAAKAAYLIDEHRALDPDSASLILQILGRLSAVDSIVDEAQADVAEALNIPNPDSDGDDPSDQTPDDSSDPMTRKAAWLDAMRRSAD